LGEGEFLGKAGRKGVYINKMCCGEIFRSAMKFGGREISRKSWLISFRISDSNTI